MRASLLTIGKASPKGTKGEAQGYLTAILHLSPSTSGGHGNVCTSATPECVALCLNTAGRGGVYKHGETTNAIQEARKRRTAFFKLDRVGFENALADDIARAKRSAERKDLTLVVRVNGTSDLPGLAHEMARRFPDVEFYDYTKHARPWERTLPNYHLTFSRAENNTQAYHEALVRGISVAVVFSTRKGEALPARWMGLRVIDGDTTDLRFLDPAGVIVGLRAKGRARKHVGGFVVAA